MITPARLILIMFALFWVYFIPNKIMNPKTTNKTLIKASVIFAIIMTAFYSVFHEEREVMADTEEKYNVKDNFHSVNGENQGDSEYATMSTYDETPMLVLSDPCSNDCKCAKGFNGQKKVKFQYSSFIPVDGSKCSSQCPDNCSCQKN